MTIDLDTIHLDHGSHDGPDDGHCILEVVSMLAKEPWGDHPQCVSPVIRAFLLSLNDQWNDEQRQKLKRFILPVIGTNTGAADDDTRAWICCDWLVRTYTPTWLRLAKLGSQAELLEKLPEFKAGMSVLSVKSTIDAVRQDAAAAWAPAWDAARAPAWAPAWDAAWAAARNAAWNAAWAAAADAARAAAWDAAGDALAPTVLELQVSALELLDRLVAVGRAES